ncbi:MAG: PTS sugar transporter subunit IIA [Deltaproteobacteria bacterium]|nr:PTS sugar transporter subunit IIA [Deltaproteobacteria bacterium]
MKIIDFIREDLIVPDLRASDKLDVLEELASRLAERHEGVVKEELVKVLIERERLASTAIGEGIAIPHGKLDAVGRLVACVGRAREGVDFDSMDGRPTHLFFVLVAPENSTGVHLKALARISRLFKDGEFRSRLLTANSAHEIYEIIADEDAKY